MTPSPNKFGPLPLVRGRENCYENLPPLLRGGVRRKADGGVLLGILKTAIKFSALLFPAKQE